MNSPYRSEPHLTGYRMVGASDEAKSGLPELRRVSLSLRLPDLRRRQLVP
jgi:hypothetical protein